MNNSNLEYSVFYKESKIKIYHNEIEIILFNCDKHFMYYAVKSLALSIMLGKPNSIEHNFTAILKGIINQKALI